MIGLDTNVLVRYLVAGDPNQAKAAAEFIETECQECGSVYINHIVLCEFSLVLTGIYGYSKEALIEVLEQILQLDQLRVEEPKVVRRALRDYRKDGNSFINHLINSSNRQHGCKYTATFNRAAAQGSGYMLVG